MDKYFKKCWNCGSSDLEDKEGYVQCRKCGATYCFVPKLGPPEFEIASIAPASQPFQPTMKYRRLTKSAKRRIAKAHLT
jgi:hypothetical protein